MSLDAVTMKRLSELLDTGLDLAPADREAWLSGLPDEDALLAPALRRALLEPAARDFLEQLEQGPSLQMRVDEALADDFSSGVLIGPYVLLRRLGVGGMGEVWLAERSDGQPRRQVALKLPMLGLRKSVLVQRFGRERDILGALAHPHIARLYDAGVGGDGQPYLALEYVEGRAITQYCDDHGLDLHERVGVLRQVMDAVQFAHANLVIHRDLKPSNVLVTSEGRAMLLDFGIAKLLQQEQAEAVETELTQLSGRALTLAYAAPEQITGAPVSIAVDIWALGVLLYELLTGRRPFLGERRELETAILGVDPPHPRGLPNDLATIVLKALKKLPPERYGTVATFAEDLDRWLQGRPVRAQGDSRWYRLRKFVSRNKGPVAAGVAVAVVVVAASVVSVWQALVAREQTRVALSEAETARAVQDFLEGIFQTNSGDQPDPVRARSRTALQLLDAGSERIERELVHAPLAKLRLLKTMAGLYREMGQLERRSALLQQRAALAATTHGRGSTQHVAALAAAGLAATEAGRMEIGRAMLEQAEASRATVQDPDTLIALDLALAGYYDYRSEAKGLEPAERAVRALRQRPPTNDLLQALYLLGSMHFYAGQPASSVEVYREGIALAPSLPGGGASLLASFHSELADTEEAVNNYPAAAANYEAAVRLVEGNQGPDGNGTVILLTRYASFLVSHGRLEEALAVVQRARARLASLPESVDRRIVAANVASAEARALLTFGRPEQALAVVDAALTVSAGAGDTATQRAQQLVHRAQALTQIGRNAEVQADLAQAEELMKERALGGSYLVALIAHFQISQHLALGRNEEAAAAWERLQRGEGKDPWRTPTVDAAAYDAEIALAAGRPAEAVAHARRGLEMLAREAAHEPLLEARVRHVLGRALTAGDDHSTAVKELQRAVELREARVDRHSPVLALSVVALGEAHRLNGNPKEARAGLQRAAAILGAHPQLGSQFTKPLGALRTALEGKAKPGA
ncbi:MAG: protein kinase [Caldimonas sp.]